MQYELFTNRGSRELNEDYIGMIQRDDRYLFVLADGLGGHGKGEVASKLVVDELVNYYMEAEQPPAIETCVEYAQKMLRIRQEAEHAQDGMKTTLVVLEIADGTARWLHVGDSRLYMFYKNKVQVRTLDHSVPQMLVTTGDIREQDIRGHEDRNRLLRVMGMEWKRPMYESCDEDVSLEDCQAFLLCSDGFWELIEEKSMENSLKKANTPEEWIKSMETQIQEAGTGLDMDNYSAIAVWL